MSSPPEPIVLSHGDHRLFYTERRSSTEEGLPGTMFVYRVFVACEECGARAGGRSTSESGYDIPGAEKKALDFFRGTWSDSCEYVTVLRVMSE